MKKNHLAKKIKFIDLFAGIGGTRIGFEEACRSLGLDTECVFTSEIKPHAIKTYQDNFNEVNIFGDIQTISTKDIPDFHYLLGGFPCQPFSAAGKRMGFFDTRGTLFFDVEKIIKDKNPEGFLLENVEGLINHDKGNTLNVIINNLKKLGYNVSYSLLDSSLYGVPQQRKRVYILGRKRKKVDMEKLTGEKVKLKKILENNKPVLDTDFTKKLLKNFKLQDLQGKAIKDKRGGKDNIHSWDIEIKGSINKFQKKLLNTLLKERRKKHWAEKKRIDWMDGMPLTEKEIRTFLDHKDLKKHLTDLINKGYLKFEYPKKLVEESVNGGVIKKRIYDDKNEKGYNIITGKLSFEINKILDPNHISPAIVATDAVKLAVVDKIGVRRLTVREGLRLFGFPEWYKIKESHNKAFDLLGNSVVVPVIRKLSKRLLS